MSIMMPIIDTHQHLIYPERFSYSWTAGIPQLAGKAFRYEDYLKAIEGTSVRRTIFMESGADDPYWQEETRFVHTLAGTPGSLMGGDHRQLPAGGRTRVRNLRRVGPVAETRGPQEDPAYRTG